MRQIQHMNHEYDANDDAMMGSASAIDILGSIFFLVLFVWAMSFFCYCSHSECLRAAVVSHPVVLRQLVSEWRGARPRALPTTTFPTVRRCQRIVPPANAA